MLNSSRLQRLTTVLETLTAAIYPNVGMARALKEMPDLYPPSMAHQRAVNAEAMPDTHRLAPVSGKVTFQYVDEEGTVESVVTMNLVDGAWQMEISDPPKRPGRKPRAKALASQHGTVQGAKGPVDPERQQRAKKAAQTRAENRKRKEAEAAADATE